MKSLHQFLAVMVNCCKLSKSTEVLSVNWDGQEQQFKEREIVDLDIMNTQ